MADDVRMWLPLERKSGTQGTDEWVTDVPISLTNRFHVAVLLFNYRWQVMSECGYRKNKKVAHKAQQSVSLLFFPHLDFFCDPLLYRLTATWNLFVLRRQTIVSGEVVYVFLCQ